MAGVCIDEAIFSSSVYRDALRLGNRVLTELMGGLVQQAGGFIESFIRQLVCLNATGRS